MIRPCSPDDFDAIYAIVNDAAQAYKGIIPADCWTEPYMPETELRRELDHGIAFWGAELNGELAGVMGIQYVDDVTLVRHAYVRTASRQHGIGGQLLDRLRKLARGPILIGTWADALWAIRFYEKHGFRLVTPEQKERLLRRYWKISDRQVETSVVLVDAAWRD